MTYYNCGFKPLKTDKTNDQIKQQLLAILKENDLIGTVFNNNLSALEDADDFSTFDFNELFLEISQEIPDTIISLDSHYDNGYIYRDYFLNGCSQSVDAEIIVRFPEPDPERWIKI